MAMPVVERSFVIWLAVQKEKEEKNQPVSGNK